VANFSCFPGVLMEWQFIIKTMSGRLHYPSKPDFAFITYNCVLSGEEANIYCDCLRSYQYNNYKLASFAIKYTSNPLFSKHICNFIMMLMLQEFCFYFELLPLIVFNCFILHQSIVSVV
jgi:hypothetical protein